MTNRTTIMIMLLAVVMMTAPIASATINVFDVTADNNVSGATSNYTVQLNTTGFNSLNITIPAGFGAVAPAAEALVARVDMWGEGPGDYMNVTFTANSSNPSTMVDVIACDSDDQMGPFFRTVNYTAGGVTDISKGDYMANLTLPTTEADGTLNLSVGGDGITNMTVTLYSVKNPATAATYTFNADGNTSGVTIILHGDVNGDNDVNVGDVTYLARYLADWAGYDTTVERAEVTGDNNVNVGDVTYLARYLADWAGYVL